MFPIFFFVETVNQVTGELLTIHYTSEVVVAKWHAPTKNILKPTMRAIEEYDMIHNGDKVLLCLSGGKDSLSLLHTLRQFQFIARNKGL